MADNVLGLKIVRIYTGYTDILELNGNPSWTRSIWDVRTSLETIVNPADNSAVLMVSSLGTGSLLTLGAKVSNSPNDFMTAWIYVPADIRISGERLKEVLGVVEMEILSDNRDEAKLADLFSTEYETLTASRMLYRSQGDRLAYRFHGVEGNYTISDLLENLNQPYYRDYRGVFFLSGNANHNYSMGDNLTGRKLSTEVLLEAPLPIDGYSPHIGGIRFTAPRYVVEGETLTIEWRKEGYKTITKANVITRNGELDTISPAEYKKLVSFREIVVVNEAGERLTDYKLTLNNTSLTEGYKMPISKSTIHEVFVKVEARGYAVYSARHDLSGGVTITMKKQCHNYTFVIRMKNGEDLSFDLESPDLLKSSPFRGYLLDHQPSIGSRNYLTYEPFPRNKVTLAIISVVAAILFAFGLGFIIGKSESKEKDVKVKVEAKVEKKEAEAAKAADMTDVQQAQEKAKKTEKSEKSEEKKVEPVVEKTTEPQKVETTPAPVVKNDAAANYLDKGGEVTQNRISNNRTPSLVWNKEEMSRIPGLEGLWDALNLYDRSKILSYKDKLGSSARFRELVNKINSSQGNPTGNYCNEDDPNITFENYLKMWNQ